MDFEVTFYMLFYDGIGSSLSLALALFFSHFELEFTSGFLKLCPRERQWEA